MVVVAIAAVLLLMAIPHFRSTMTKNRVRDASDRLQAHLRAARLRAMSAARTVEVALDATSNALVVRMDADGNGSIGPGETTTLSLSTAPSLTLQAAATWGAFRSGGGFTCTNGYWKVTVRSPGAASQYVYVFPAGHVQASEVPLD